jgi:hypothetical protein
VCYRLNIRIFVFPANKDALCTFLCLLWTWLYKDEIETIYGMVVHVGALLKPKARNVSVIFVIRGRSLLISSGALEWTGKCVWLGGGFSLNIFYLPNKWTKWIRHKLSKLGGGWALGAQGWTGKSGASFSSGQEVWGGKFLKLTLLHHCFPGQQ